MPDDFRGGGEEPGPGGREPEHFDVLIVGAGISGIDAAVRLQEKCPGKSFAILEGREEMGGTWDLFRYPGVRSDSDMYTLGFPFRPWDKSVAIADGPSILQYLKDTAAEFGVDRKIRFKRRVEAARWSTAELRWTLDVRDGETGELEQMSCSFLYACTGYYRYDRGYTPDFDGLDEFEGEVVHPQLWNEDLEYADKKVVIIGSGATAMTLVPEMAKKARLVTMLQRSPTYLLPAPEKDPMANTMARLLPDALASTITRWKYVALATAMYKGSRRWPDRFRKFFIEGVRRSLPEGYDVERHFTPYYDPWDQRLCVVLKGDLFEAIKAGTVEVVTEHIDRFTKKGILLKSGEELEADLIVTATGLELQLFGGAVLEVDGEEIVPSEQMAYRAMMVGDVPNMAFAVGYTNASWTLKVDLVAQYVCRLLNHMDEKGYTTCCPIRDPDMGEAKLLDFDAGYVQRALPVLPRGGEKAPWRVYENYPLDLATLLYAPLEDGTMEFSRRRPRLHTRARAQHESRAR
jgi:cation diffusion facilitator CzcD-associated flavoprotein CzcO